MNKFVKKNNDGTSVCFDFFQSKVLPKDIPISTPLTFAFGGQNVLVVKKQNDWWDIVGGKMEGDETYIDTIKREAFEEGGVRVDDISLVGYVLATNFDDKIMKVNTVLPITMSFIKAVDWNFAPTYEVKIRDLVNTTLAKEYFSAREDNGQLLSIFEYVISVFDEQNYRYEFEYVTENFGLYSNLPTTQACVFIMNRNLNFYAVREHDSKRFLLPGGGCHLYESGEECAIREIKEELQIDVESLTLFGVVIFRILNGQHKILSESLQMRYFARYESDKNLTTNVLNYEIAEIKEVPIDQLGIIEHMKNSNAPAILASLNKFI